MSFSLTEITAGFLNHIFDYRFARAITMTSTTTADEFTAGAALLSGQQREALVREVNDYLGGLEFLVGRLDMMHFILLSAAAGTMDELERHEQYADIAKIIRDDLHERVKPYNHIFSKIYYFAKMDRDFFQEDEPWTPPKPRVQDKDIPGLVEGAFNNMRVMLQLLTRSSVGGRRRGARKGKGK